MRNLSFIALIASLIIALGIGCRTAPEAQSIPASWRHIEFGIYSAPQDKLPAARALGIDFVVGSGATEYLDAAAAAGLQVIASGTTNDAHPALLGHYMADEPDFNLRSPEQMAADYRSLKQKSRKPCFLNVSSGYSVELYAEHCDAVMFDWYPVGWQPAETFFAHARVARLAAREKPLYAVVQTFDWAKYPKIMSARDARKPLPAELRAMAVWAAMNNARGICFYPYADGASSLEESPELVQAIREVIALIRANELFFTQPKAWAPYPFKYKNTADTYNAISDTTIAVRFSKLPGDATPSLLVAANTVNRPISVAMKRNWRTADGAEISFAPYEVKFFRLDGAAK